MPGNTFSTAQQWTIQGADGVGSLQYGEVAVPPLGDSEVLVHLKGASLNFRDLIITQGKYPWTVKSNVVPGSDGAGIVVAIGKNVTRFGVGDKVITMLNQKHTAGSITPKMLEYSLGASIDGTLRTVGAFDEQGLVSMPEGLSFTEAATLSCAGVTAWNALFGLPGKQLMAGQWILTQGTGGVSLFAIQLAKAVGARVIATTSSGEKAKFLEKLGVDHIINYRETPEWSTAAKELTGGVGVDIVVEVAGPSTLKQSGRSLKLDGMLSVIGFIGGESVQEAPSVLECWINLYTARGIWVASRVQLEELCRAIEGNVEKLRPIVDRKTFALNELNEAYEYMTSGKNLGKVCITI